MEEPGQTQHDDMANEEREWAADDGVSAMLAAGDLREVDKAPWMNASILEDFWFSTDQICTHSDFSKPNTYNQYVGLKRSGKNQQKQTNFLKWWGCSPKLRTLLPLLDDEGNHITWSQFSPSTHIRAIYLVCTQCRVTVGCAVRLVKSWFGNQRTALTAAMKVS
jgi:hypothetical protein